MYAKQNYKKLSTTIMELISKKKAYLKTFHGSNCFQLAPVFYLAQYVKIK